MKQKIDWLNHGLEFIVVVIGILLAFQLNEWSNRQDERALVKRHLESLHDELVFNTRTLKQAHQTIQNELAIFDQLIGQFENGIDAEKTNQLVMSVLNTRVVYLRRTAYSTLKETGDIRMVEDFELKGQIVNLYEYYRWVKGVDEGDYQFKQDMLYPFAIENLDLLNGQTQATDVYQRKELRNIIGTMRFILVYREEKYRQALEYTELLQHTLSDYHKD